MGLGTFESISYLFRSLTRSTRNRYQRNCTQVRDSTISYHICFDYGTSRKKHGETIY